MVSREQASILILSALVIASGFVILTQRNRLNEQTSLYDNLETKYVIIQAQYELLYSSYQELDDQVSEYRKEIIQLSQDMERLEYYRDTWHSSRDQFTQILEELVEQAYSENISVVLVQSRKDVYRIGDTIAFELKSSVPLYSSYFDIHNPEGTLVFEGDPISEWIEIDGNWVAPFYGQTAYHVPMILSEDFPLGNWTWIYRFGELIEIKGWFTVDEAIDYIGIGIADLSDNNSSIYDDSPPDLGGGGPLTSIPVVEEHAIELAVNAFKDNLIDPYDVYVTKISQITVDHPIDSETMVEAWHITVKGKGTEKSSGELIGMTTGYIIIKESGVIIEGLSVGAGLANIRYDDVSINVVEPYLILTLFIIGSLALIYNYKKRQEY